MNAFIMFLPYGHIFHCLTHCICLCAALGFTIFAFHLAKLPSPVDFCMCRTACLKYSGTWLWSKVGIRSVQFLSVKSFLILFFCIPGPTSLAPPAPASFLSLSLSFLLHLTFLSLFLSFFPLSPSLLWFTPIFSCFPSLSSFFSPLPHPPQKGE